ALDAEQFGGAPTLFAVLSPLKGLVDDENSIRHLSGRAQALRQYTQKSRVTRHRPSLQKLTESCPEQLRPLIQLAAAEQQRTHQPPAFGLPHRHGKLCRIVEQHRNVGFCCREIPDPECNPARCAGQRITQRNRMISCARALDKSLSRPHRPVWLPLEEEDRSERD